MSFEALSLVTETAPAVESPEVQTDTQTPSPLETQAPVNPEGTDGGEAAQTETAPAQEDTAHIDAAIEARLDAEREHIREEERHRLATESREEQQRRSIGELRQAFPSALQAARQRGRDFGLEDGQIQALLQPFEAYNLGAHRVYESLANGPIEDAIQAILPGESYVKFAKDADGKDARSFLETFAEHRALSTRAVKGMDLEEALKASAKVRADHTKALAEAEEKGRIRGRKDPPGDPPSNGRLPPTSVTYAQLQRMTAAQIKALPFEVFDKAVNEE